MSGRIPERSQHILDTTSRIFTRHLLFWHFLGKGLIFT
jgi:hypothetical protein